MKAKMIYDTDPYLMPFREAIDRRHARILEARERIAVDGSLSAGINNHLYYGLHRDADGSWVLREWAPNASRIYLIGECNNWHRTAGYAFQPLGGGNWELRLPSLFNTNQQEFPHPLQVGDELPKGSESGLVLAFPDNQIVVFQEFFQIFQCF